MLPGTTRILFNAEDRIVRVDVIDAVDPEDTPQPGTELTDYIGSEELAGLYRQLFAAVRNNRPRISLLARCDDSSSRAVMAIEIARYSDDGKIEFRSSLVRRSDRKFRIPEAADAGVVEVIVLVCSWCNFVSDNGSWIELETFIERQGWLVSDTPRVQFTHGLCPSCSSYLRAAAVGDSGTVPPVDV